METVVASFLSECVALQQCIVAEVDKGILLCRYMKMLYDRAATADEAPKYLLLFGDGAWDNRMLSAV